MSNGFRGIRANHHLNNINDGLSPYIPSQFRIITEVYAIFVKMVHIMRIQARGQKTKIECLTYAYPGSYGEPDQKRPQQIKLSQGFRWQRRATFPQD